MSGDYLGRLSNRLKKEYSDLNKEFKDQFKVKEDTWECSWQVFLCFIQTHLAFFQLVIRDLSKFPHEAPIVEIRASQYRSGLDYDKFIRVPFKEYLPCVSLLKTVHYLRERLSKIRANVGIIQLRIEINALDVTPQTSEGQGAKTMEAQIRQRAVGTPVRQGREQPSKMTKLLLKLSKDTRRQLEMEIEGKKYCYHAKQTDELGPGIYNFGNSCFVNSVLQMLYYRKMLRYLLVVVPTNNSRLQGISYLFMYLETQARPFSEDRVICDIENNFRGNYEQRDAYEFMMSFLDTMVQSSPFANAFRDLLEVKYKEQTNCLRCKQGSEQNRNYLVLDLNGVERWKSVDEALKAEHNGECPECKGPTRFRNNYKNAPPYLLIHPNWSQTPPRSQEYYPPGSQQSPYKKRSPYEDERSRNRYRNSSVLESRTMESSDTITLSSSKYILAGVIEHHGSSKSGHYVYYQSTGKSWHEFNDSIVRESNKPSGRAIVLVYEKEKQAGSVELYILQKNAQDIIKKFTDLCYTKKQVKGAQEKSSIRKKESTQQKSSQADIPMRATSALSKRSSVEQSTLVLPQCPKLHEPNEAPRMFVKAASKSKPQTGFQGHHVAFPHKDVAFNSSNFRKRPTDNNIFYP